MIKTNRGSSISQIMTASKAVVEYLFDNDEFCDVKWCKPLKELKEGGERSLVNHTIEIKNMMLSNTNKYGTNTGHSQHVNVYWNHFTPSTPNKTKL